MKTKKLIQNIEADYFNPNTVIGRILQHIEKNSAEIYTADEITKLLDLKRTSAAANLSKMAARGLVAKIRLPGRYFPNAHARSRVVYGTEAAIKELEKAISSGAEK